MKYAIRMTSGFKKDYKLALKRGYKEQQIRQVIEMLAAGILLPERYRDHSLSGEWAGHRECHISPDWLLIYRVEKDILILTLTRTGTHNDLF